MRMTLCPPRVRTIVLALAAAAALATTAFAQTPAAAAPRSGTRAAATVPPLIDREVFFGNPEIAGAQLSPDGQYVSFIKPYKDTRNVWVKKAGEPFTAARLVIADTKRATVMGVEPVTVPAGTFTAWKVEITSAEGDPEQTTLWVAQDSRQVVKVAATLPQMGNATFTSELVQ